LSGGSVPRRKEKSLNFVEEEGRKKTGKGGALLSQKGRGGGKGQDRLVSVKGERKKKNYALSVWENGRSQSSPCNEHFQGGKSRGGERPISHTKKRGKSDHFWGEKPRLIETR